MLYARTPSRQFSLQLPELEHELERAPITGVHAIGKGILDLLASLLAFLEYRLRVKQSIYDLASCIYESNARRGASNATETRMLCYRLEAAVQPTI